MTYHCHPSRIIHHGWHVLRSHEAQWNACQARKMQAYNGRLGVPPHRGEGKELKVYYYLIGKQVWQNLHTPCLQTVQSESLFKLLVRQMLQCLSGSTAYVIHSLLQAEEDVQ